MPQYVVLISGTPAKSRPDVHGCDMTMLATLILPLSSVTFAFERSHISGKVICVLLFAGSIFAWSIMITKLRDLRKSSRASRLFLSAYRKESHPVALFLKEPLSDASPIHVVYGKTCNSLATALGVHGADPAELCMGAVGSTMKRLGEMQVSALRNVAQRTVADQALILEDQMGFLATAVTAAPFLGLLGTVWGVMVAFGNIRGASAMLSEVTPGISGALLTTVVGLLVALPSSIGYNIIVSQIRRLRVRMDNFTEEFMSDVERYFLHELENE